MRKPAAQNPVLPVCLLLKGKPCLVVGGGVIASRKVSHLLDAEADVTVVSPAMSAGLLALPQAARLRLVTRPFEDADVAGKCLAFAATDSEAVNRQVLEACQARGILCSAADRNWPQGDFILPATCRKNGLVVTVSTGGRSCSQSRLE